MFIPTDSHLQQKPALFDLFPSTTVFHTPKAIKHLLRYKGLPDVLSISFIAFLNKNHTLIMLSPQANEQGKTFPSVTISGY